MTDIPKMPLETAAGFYWNGKQWESSLGIKMSSGTFSVLNEAIEGWHEQEIVEARVDEQTHTQADIDGNVEYWPDGETVTSQLQRLLELEALRNKLKEKL